MKTWYPVSKSLSDKKSIAYLSENGDVQMVIDADYPLSSMKRFALVVKDKCWFLAKRDGSLIKLESIVDGELIGDCYAKVSIASNSDSSVSECIGIVDEHGEFIFKPKRYEDISSVTESHYVATKAPYNLASLYRINGDVVKRNFALGKNYISEGMLAASDGENYCIKGYIDIDGNWVIEPKFEFAHPFYNGVGAVNVRKGKKRYPAFVDSSGNEVCKFSGYLDFSPLHGGFSYGVIPVWGKEIGLVDTSGAMLFSGDYDNVGRMSCGSVALKVGDRWGLASRDGSWIIAPRFLSYFVQDDGFFVFGDGKGLYSGRLFLVNHKGDILHEEASGSGSLCVGYNP